MLEVEIAPTRLIRGVASDKSSTVEGSEKGSFPASITKSIMPAVFPSWVRYRKTSYAFFHCSSL